MLVNIGPRPKSESLANIALLAWPSYLWFIGSSVPPPLLSAAAVPAAPWGCRGAASEPSQRSTRVVLAISDKCGSWRLATFANRAGLWRMRPV